MRSFHRTTAILASIFSLMILLCITASISYMQRNDIKFSDLINGNIYFGSTSMEFTTDHLLTPNDNSGNFETKIKEESDTFAPTEELFISAVSEEIQFIEEDRTDIQVDYYHEYPDTDRYQFTYHIETSENKLTVLTTSTVSNLNMNKDYKKYIRIHIPKDYRFSNITIDTAMAKITNDMIYSDTASLSILSNFGDVDISLANAMDHLNISSNLGNIIVETSYPIRQYDLSADMGDIQLALLEPTEEVKLHAAMGNIHIEADSSIGELSINNNLGDITGDFYANVDKFTATANMGKIDLSFQENSSMTVYANSNLGEVDSAFDLTSNQSKSDYIFTTDLGSIELKKILPDSGRTKR